MARLAPDAARQPADDRSGARHAGLWLAFGNQHIGFTTGPATGAAIAAMIGGAAPPYDVTPFAPGRYIS